MEENISQYIIEMYVTIIVSEFSSEKLCLASEAILVKSPYSKLDVWLRDLKTMKERLNKSSNVSKRSYIQEEALDLIGVHGNDEYSL